MSDSPAFLDAPAIQLAGPEYLPNAVIQLPLSKSESARAIIINAVAGRQTNPATVADCDDTKSLLAGIDKREGTVDVGPAGTAMRFLTAFYAATEATDIFLTGTERMCRRPMAPLVEALRTLGADIEYAETDGHAPLKIHGKKLRGGRVDIDATVSSQFISALMLVEPLMELPLEIVLEGEPVSQAYTKLTAAMIEEGTPQIGADWSAASYWYEIAATTSGTYVLPGLDRNSKQGDRAMIEIGAQLGVTTEGFDPEDYDEEDSTENFNPAEIQPGTLTLCPSPELFARIERDMTDTPDLVPAVAMTAALLGLPFRLWGLKTLRGKECDRISALAKEALKLGLVFESEGDDVLAWNGQRMPITEMPVIDTHDDHRMAMAFAPAATYIPGLVILNPGVVSKSYPRFWDDLQMAGFTIKVPGIQ